MHEPIPNLTFERGGMAGFPMTSLVFRLSDLCGIKITSSLILFKISWKTMHCQHQLCFYNVVRHYGTRN